MIAAIPFTLSPPLALALLIIGSALAVVFALS